MTIANLTQMQQQVDLFNPLEQVHLLEYIASQIRDTVASIQISSTTSEKNSSEEWAALFRIGNEIASRPSYGPETMTQSVIMTRR